MKNKLILFLKGGLIGIALAIPGISAGTMALITGLYTPIIHLLSSFTISSLTCKTSFKNFWRSSSYLVYVFLGSLAGVYWAIQWMAFLIKTYPLQTYSLFSGIILASIPFLYQQMKQDKKGLGVFLMSAVFTFGLSFFQSLFFQGYFWVFLSIYIAVGALLLPGVSGSYILIIMGTYSHILEEIQGFSWKVFLYIITGALSLITVSKWIRYLLKNYPAITLSCLTGMTLGGGVGIFPLKTSQQFIENGGVGFLFLTAGAVSVFLLKYLTQFYKNH